MSPVALGANSHEFVIQHLSHLHDSSRHCFNVLQELFLEFWIVSDCLDNVGAVDWAHGPRASDGEAHAALDVLGQLLISIVNNMASSNTFTVQTEVLGK